MKPTPVAQFAAAMLVVLTPVFVVNIAFRVAQAYARTVAQSLHRPKSVGHLRLATTVAMAAVASVALVTPARLWVQLIAGLAFACLSALALRTLGEIDRLSKPAREVTASVRSASLVVRRAEQHLPWTWRFGVYGLAVIGVATFAVRLVTPLANRQWLLPVTLAAASVVFLWLYEVWIHELVIGPALSEGRVPRTRRRFIRSVFTTEAALVAGCLAGAHLLVDLDWQTNGAVGVAVSLATAVLAIIGCALALSSSFTRRTYVPVIE